MTEDILIATLGRNAQERIDFVFRKRHADRLILLHSEVNKEDAEDIKETIRSSGDIPVEIVQVEPWNFHEILYQVIKYINEHKKARFSFNPSLGTRIMSVALFVAATFTRSVVHLVKEDGTGKAIDVIDVYPLNRRSLTRPKKEILKTLIKRKNKAKNEDEEWIPSIALLARAIKRTRATTSAHVKSLRIWGYVEVKTERKPSPVRVTPLGEVIYEMSKSWSVKDF